MSTNNNKKRNRQTKHKLSYLAWWKQECYRYGHELFESETCLTNDCQSIVAEYLLFPVFSLKADEETPQGLDDSLFLPLSVAKKYDDMYENENDGTIRLTQRLSFENAFSESVWAIWVLALPEAIFKKKHHDLKNQWHKFDGDIRFPNRERGEYVLRRLLRCENDKGDEKTFSDLVDDVMQKVDDLRIEPLPIENSMGGDVEIWIGLEPSLSWHDPEQSLYWTLDLSRFSVLV